MSDTHIIFVVCPNCGATVPTTARVANVRVDKDRLLIHFSEQWADHACEGQA